MNWAGKILLLLLPTQRIRPRWRDSWVQRDRDSFQLQVRIVHLLAAAVYFSHLFYIDSLYHLEPKRDWMILRLIGAGSNLLGFALTFFLESYTGAALRIPMIVTGLVCSYLQAVSMHWFAGTPYIFAIATPVMATLSLRVSIISSALYLLACYGCEVSAWLARPHELATIMSAATFGLLFVVMLRTRLSADVAAFIADQQNMESQRKLIEAEMELNQQIKAFLPKEIYERFLFHVKHQGLQPSLAMSKVLEPKEGMTACLYTDIRGFTQKTKKNPNFTKDNVAPDLRRCTDVIEDQHGIPKIVGDLVFAYFDSLTACNSIRALYSALLLDTLNQEMNAVRAAGDYIERFVLVSFGDALVGNVGGTESALDITVLGNPANILSRIDLLTKDAKFKLALANDRIVMTRHAFDHIRPLMPELDMRRIALDSIGLRIKDFEEETELFVVPNTEANNALLSKRLAELVTTTGTKTVSHYEALQERKTANA